MPQLPTPAMTASAPAHGETNIGFLDFFLIAAWFGIVAGLVEGVGLLAFQRINWQRWGPMAHVSKEIIWISPIVDVVFFVGVAVGIAVLQRIWRKLPGLATVIFVLTFLAGYDWLTLTERLYHRACLLLALGVATAVTRWILPRHLGALPFFRRTAARLMLLWLIAFAGIQVGKQVAERREIGSLPAAKPDAPNIVLVVIDTMRADHFSSYGYPRATTPNLDRLASQGALFENAISTCSWTLPSHASLLTGRYPLDHGMQNAQPMPWLGWGDKALRGYPTLGGALEGLGYSTGAFSANQSYFTSNVGLGRGFAHFEDYFQSPRDMFLRTLFGREFERAYLHRSERSAWTRGLRALGLAALMDNRKHADEVNRETLAWIDREQPPFFAMLNYIEVHDASALGWSNSSPQWGTASAIDKYDSALSYVDQQIAGLMDELQRRNLLRNTLVVVTGDHGESLGQHHMQYHGIALYREELQVPLLLWMPSRIPPGMRIAPPVSNAEIAPTIMQLAGATQRTFPGHDLSTLWGSRGAADWPGPVSDLQKNEIVIDPDRQARKFVPTAMDGDMHSLVTPEWHLILHQKLGAQIYDWRKDPGELNNLINTQEGQSAYKELLRELQNSQRVP